ncbi:hypothetical protein HDU96_000303, partial [Phlyctochytrium bullatum]
MHPGSLLSLRLRRLQHKALALPSAATDDFGVVAIIDISGFTRLAIDLADSGETERLQGILNPPFDAIISHVHFRCGSVVKLAGDSAVATWTGKPPSVLLQLATLCSIELISRFGSTLLAPSPTSNSLTSGSVTRQRTKSEFSSGGGSHGYTSNGAHPQTPVDHAAGLALHVGIGAGTLHHALVGCQLDRTAPTAGALAASRYARHDFRAEYVIGGQALLYSGQAIAVTSKSQLAMPIYCWKMLDIPTELLPPHAGKEGFHVLDAGSSSPLLDRLRDLLETRLRGTAPTDNDNEGRADLLPLDHWRLGFVEESLARHVAECVQSSPDETPLASVSFIDYNQIRNITVLFAHFPDIQVSHLGSNPEVLVDVQFIARASMEAARRHGGTCRQLNCDEKALSVLLMWGVPGFSHEKGDQPHAVSAALDLLKELHGRKWLHPQTFSIAVTFGKAYAGIIGSNTRSEGTVLGPCVNLAARLMCQSRCFGTILCDGSIRDACRSFYTFEDRGVLHLKGIPEPVEIFSPVAVAKIRSFDVADTVLEGRQEEIGVLLAAVDDWKRGGRASAIVTGKSGFGKTALVMLLVNMLRKETDVMVCYGVARENRRESNLVYEQILESLRTHLSDRGLRSDTIRQIFDMSRPRNPPPTNAATAISSIAASTRRISYDSQSLYGTPIESQLSMLNGSGEGGARLSIKELGIGESEGCLLNGFPLPAAALAL